MILRGGGHVLPRGACDTEGVHVILRGVRWY